MRVDDLFREYFKQTKMLRGDLYAIMEFNQARSNGSTPDGVKLFWYMSRPLNMSDLETPFRSAPALDNDLETKVLKWLARLERECRIPYVPDSDDPPDFLTLSRYIYVGAASALRHLKRDGFSEDVTSTLNEVWKSLTILEKEGYIERVIGYSEEKLPPWQGVSLHGVTSLVLSEIFHIKYRNGEYEEALSIALDVLWDRDLVEEASSHSRPMSPAEWQQIWDHALGDDSCPSNEIIDEEEEKRYEKELEVYNAIQMCWSWQGLTPQQIVDAFEGLRVRGKSEDWGQVASVCKRFVSDWEYSEDGSLLLDRVTNTDGREEPWILYWRGAEAWASAQLEPNQLLDLWHQQERDASQKRLKRYFFGEAWRNIPEKAQKHLVDAELSWFDDRGGAIGSVLNDLRLAVENMCHTFIWESLRKAEGELLLEFKRDSNLSKGFDPTLSTYVRLCGQGFFRRFVKNTGLSEKDQEFLTSNEQNSLGSALNYLQRGRNIAEHKQDKQMTRNEVKQFVDLFFGIGEPGVLRRLAEVVPKLAGRQSSRL